MSHKPYETTGETKAIIYDHTVDVCFSHLDAYGHVNSKHYLDYVVTSRLKFLEDTFNITILKMVEKNCGFYLIETSQKYLRPINGMQKVRVKSHVAENQDGVITVVYDMINEDGDRLYSKGEFKFAVIDLAKQKKMPTPEWLQPYFFEG